MSLSSNPRCLDYIQFDQTVYKYLAEKNMEVTLAKEADLAKSFSSMARTYAPSADEYFDL